MTAEHRKQRLHRLERIYVRSPIYFITSATADRLRILAMDDQRITLSQWMKSLKNNLSKTLRSANVQPPHFQKGFFDHLLRSSESYSEKWHYVRENPVRAGLVQHWQDWPFSGEIFALEYRSDA
jgi:putative transposase